MGLLTNLQYLELSTNSMTGTLPSAIGDMSSLTVLSTGINPMRGSIPSELGKLTKLTSIKFLSSKLTGTIPSSMSSLLIPTTRPSVIPSPNPTAAPTTGPTTIPSHTPSSVPSNLPSSVPSHVPSTLPSSSSVPSSAVPSASPSVDPSAVPVSPPTAVPTLAPLHLGIDIKTLLFKYAVAIGGDGIDSMTEDLRCKSYESKDIHTADFSLPQSFGVHCSLVYCCRVRISSSVPQTAADKTSTAIHAPNYKLQKIQMINTSKDSHTENLSRSITISREYIALRGVASQTTTESNGLTSAEYLCLSVVRPDLYVYAITTGVFSLEEGGGVSYNYDLVTSAATSRKLHLVQSTNSETRERYGFKKIALRYTAKS
eukprot:gene10494-21891_t